MFFKHLTFNFLFQTFVKNFKIIYQTITIITDVQSTRRGVCQPLIMSIVPGGQDSVRVDYDYSDYE